MSRWQKRARVIIAIVGLAVLALVLLTVRRRPPAAVEQAAPVLDPKAVTESTGGRILLVKGTESPGFVDFKHSLGYADGTAKLIEPCATVNRSDRQTRICAREANIGAERAHMTMTGDVRLSAQDGLTAQTGEATYNQSEGIVRAKGKVTFSKGAMSGSAVGMTYDDQRDLLTLLRQVHVRIKPGEEGGAGEIQAGRAEYARGEHYMRFEGNVRMVRNARHISAETALVRLAGDDERIEGLELRGKARIETKGATGVSQTMAARDMNLSIGPDGEVLERAVLVGKGSIEDAGAAARARRISAEMLDLTFHDTGDIAAIAAREDVELTLPAQGNAPFREITATRMDGTGAEGGGLNAARFAGGVVFRERGNDKAERVARSQTLEIVMQPSSGEIEDARFAGGARVQNGALRTSSAEARYEVQKGVFALTGRQGQNDPRVEDERLTVEATRIDITLEGPLMEAQGNVRSVIRPASTSKSKSPAAGRDRTVPGMLEDDQPAYVTAAALDYDGTKSLATYRGDSRLWQGDTTIQGATIVIDEQSGDLIVRESVRTSFVLEERDEKTGEMRKVPSRASSKDMHYENGARRATYRTNAQMTGPQGEMDADRIVLYFVEGGGSLDRAEAYTSVRLRGEKRSAAGDELTYFAEDGRYLMTGAPVRSVEECRETTCKTLTFWRSTDRIVCDGNEENRTLTKSVGTCTEPRTK
jgi:lipopolysaccharide export system protein LptA